MTTVLVRGPKSRGGDPVAPAIRCLDDADGPAQKMMSPFAPDGAVAVTAVLVWVDTGIEARKPSLLSMVRPLRLASHTGLYPMGNYRATLSSPGITDAAGNPLVGASPLDFFFVPADANHDRRVNALDFNALASNYGQPIVDFTRGDFNYDGIVNSLDFNALGARFGTYLAPPGSAQPAQASASQAAVVPAANLFSVAPVSLGDKETSDL